MRELSAQVQLPPVIRHIREAQAENLRDRRNARRGMQDDALAFFWGLRPMHMRDLDDEMIYDIAITPEHRRMFPALPDCDGVSVFRQAGRLCWEFFNVETRARG